MPSRPYRKLCIRVKFYPSGAVMLLWRLALSVGEGASACPVQLDRIDIQRLVKFAKSTLARPAAKEYSRLISIKNRRQSATGCRLCRLGSFRFDYLCHLARQFGGFPGSCTDRLWRRFLALVSLLILPIHCPIRMPTGIDPTNQVTRIRIITPPLAGYQHPRSKART